MWCHGKFEIHLTVTTLCTHVYNDVYAVSDSNNALVELIQGPDFRTYALFHCGGCLQWCRNYTASHFTTEFNIM